MTDLELNKALAIAIGWRPKQIQERCGMLFVMYGDRWTYFSHTSTDVIWAIAERYGCFPSPIVSDSFAKHKKQGYPDIEGWEVFMVDYERSTLQRATWKHYTADSAAKAVAMAVIGGAS